MAMQDANNILHLYYSGVLRRLRSEVEVLNQLIPHNASKGAENEECLRNLIRNFIPRRFSVGSGIIIDSYGNRSRQVDLIIYDDHIYPNLFGQLSTSLFPVETVIATIEVKTYVDGPKLVEVFENSRSIRALKHYTDKVVVNQPSNEFPINIVEHPTRPPSTHLFAFRVDSLHFGTWKNRYLTYPDPSHIIDSSLLLDIATVSSYPNPDDRQQSTLQLGFFAMRTADAGIPGPAASFLDHEKPGEVVLINGSLYKSASFEKDGRYPVLMPERAFLSFILRLNRVLDLWPKHHSFDPARYLDPNYTAFHSV
jgi:hypothetical protein